MKKILLSVIVGVMLLASVGFVVAATCPSGTTPIYVETINVDASQSTAVSTSALENEVTYLLEASGKVFAGDTIDFDAMYSITNRIPLDTWTDSVSGYESYGTSLLDLLVDGTDGLWGAYNPEHTYSLIMIGTDTQVDLLIYDIYYPNNAGSLAVDVSKCAYASGEILTPLEGEVVFGETLLSGIYNDNDNVPNNIVRWAVRQGTCTAGVGTVFGNVDGHHDSYEWDGHLFTSTIDTSTLTPGNYCFVFNPLDDNEGVHNVRETREFIVADTYIHGGGHALEEMESKRKDWLDFSFGGWVADAGVAGLLGEWQVNLHNVGGTDLDKSRFHTTEITSLNLYVGNTNTCTEAMNLGSDGE